jgi:hypothetical protein
VKSTPLENKPDVDIAELAERETLAQLEIIQILKPVSFHQRKSVMRAMWHLLSADAEVSGVLSTFNAHATSERRPEHDGANAAGPSGGRELE